MVLTLPTLHEFRKVHIIVRSNDIQYLLLLCNDANELLIRATLPLDKLTIILGTWTEERRDVKLPIKIKSVTLTVSTRLLQLTGRWQHDGIM